MRHILLGLGIVALVAVALPLNAHHSAAVLYHLDQQITVEGTVTRFSLGNPHARIFLNVKAADGTPMANAFLSMGHILGMEMQQFGDSTGQLSLTQAGPSTVA